VIRLQIDRTIDRPIEEVFDRLADIDGYRAWMPQNGLFRDSESVAGDTSGVGTEFRDITRMGVLPGRVTDFERPHRIAFHQVLRRGGKVVFDSRPSYELEAAGEGTIVHHHAEGELHGLLRLFEPFARLMARRERTRTVEALKASFG
jgi:uncharacterized protein YndB with AHSA1/START domain